LLADLLNCSPEIHCDGEILTRRVLWPHWYVKARAMRFPGKVYGFKLMSHHLRRQRVALRDFLLAHHRQGGRTIYLSRYNILRQAISGLLAGQTGLWRSDPQTLDARRTGKSRIDCQDLLRTIRWIEAQRAKEQQALDGLPFVTVVYEKHLLDPDARQRSLDQLFGYLGVRPVPVRTSLVRVSTDRLSDLVENFDEVARAVSIGGYARFLSPDAPNESYSPDPGFGSMLSIRQG